MQYMRIVFSLVMLLVVITFCVNNTQAFTLSFMGFRLAVPLQLWTLMLIFFVAGMVPILVLELPKQASHYLRMRTIKGRIKQAQRTLKQLGGSASTPAE
jgi:uncharacterized membrane protein YciS (DUF1049 family)